MATQASERDYTGAASDRQPTGPLPGEITLLDLPAIYRDFCSKLPFEAIQRTKGRETRKGYDTDGYGYQYCIDILNNVAGLGHWRIISEEIFCDEGEYNSGRKAYEVGYDVTIQLGNWTPAGFQVLAETPKTPGGHVSALKADARKGALTNAIKKAIAFFSIGAAAYRGELDDDNLPPEGRQPGQGYTRQATPAARPQTQTSAQSRLQTQAPKNGRQNKSGNGEDKPGNGRPNGGQAAKNMTTLPDWPDEPPDWLPEPSRARQPAVNSNGNGNSNAGGNGSHNGSGNGNGRRRLF